MTRHPVAMSIAMPSVAMPSVAVPSAAGLPAHWTSIIADAVTAELGEVTVLLLGSRAVGTAVSGSDCDLAVVASLWRVAPLVRKLSPLSCRLELLLGVKVSLNPIPAFRLAHARSSLYILKVRSEAVVLTSRRDFSLDPPGPIVPSAFAAASYLLCAILAVVEAIDGATLGSETTTPVLAHAIRKAVLHVAQLRLLDRGEYASTLPDALRLLGDEQLAALAESADQSVALERARELLLREAHLRPLTVPRWKAPVRNAQYALIASLRGRSRWRAMLCVDAAEMSLAQSLIWLLETTTSTRAVSTAAWQDLRDIVATEWRDAHPLAGVLA